MAARCRRSPIEPPDRPVAALTERITGRFESRPHQSSACTPRTCAASAARRFWRPPLVGPQARRHGGFHAAVASFCILTRLRGLGVRYVGRSMAMTSKRWSTALRQRRDSPRRPVSAFTARHPEGPRLPNRPRTRTRHHLHDTRSSILPRPTEGTDQGLPQAFRRSRSSRGRGRAPSLRDHGGDAGPTV